MDFFRARNIRVEGIRFQSDANLVASSNIQLVGNKMVSSNLRSVDRILYEGNEIAGATSTGINFSKGPNRDVTIRHNYFHHHSDAIQMKQFDGVLVENNEFSEIRRQTGSAQHPDVIQTYSGGANLTIINNYVHDFNAQGFFIANGVVRNVVVENNLLVRKEGYASPVRIADADGVRFVNNTVDGLARFSGGTRDAVVINNVIRTLSLDYKYGLTIKQQDYNLINSGPRLGVHDLAGLPRFVDPVGRNFELAPASVGVDAGTSVGAPALDRRGRNRFDDPRTPNRGAGSIEYVDVGALEVGGRDGPAGRPGEAAASGADYLP